MAAVIPGGGDDPSDERRFRDADRGQLLLISGLVVAVSLVALVVLLNASIYSENVATRGVEAADGEALEVRAAAVEETGALIDGTNRAEPTNHSAAARAVRNGIGDLDAHLAGAYADRGGVTHADLELLQNGSRVTGNLSSNATVAEGVERTRGFTLDLNTSSLEGTTQSQAVNESFRVAFSNATDATNETREVYAYENDGNVTLAVGENGGDPVVVCETPIAGRDRIAIDLTRERLGDEPCWGIWSGAAGDLNGSYDVALTNAAGANGTVAATVRPTLAETDSELTVSDAVYAATIDLRYRTADLRFETRIRVAPGEPDV